MRRLYEDRHKPSSKTISGRTGLQEEEYDEADAGILPPSPSPSPPKYPKRKPHDRSAAAAYCRKRGTEEEPNVVSTTSTSYYQDHHQVAGEDIVSDEYGETSSSYICADVQHAEVVAAVPPMSSAAAATHHHAFGAHVQPAPPSSINLALPTTGSSTSNSSGWHGHQYNTTEEHEVGTVVSDITDSRSTHVIEAFTRDEMANQLRQQFRSQMQQELHKNVITAQVIDETTNVVDDEQEPPTFWTKRTIVVTIGVTLLVVVGIVVGVVIAITGGKEPQEEYLEGGVTINGTANSEDRFGDSVVLSSDGSTLAASAYLGHYIRVFRRSRNNNDNGGGEAWNQIGQTLNFTYQHDNKFDAKLDLSQDGSILAVGQWNNDDAGVTNAGYAVLYWFDGNAWTPLGQPLLGSGVKDQFGYSIALAEDGRTVAVGAKLGRPSTNIADAGYVRVFTLNGIPGDGRNDVEWEQLGSDLAGTQERDQFGMKLALSADGRRLAVGAHGGTAKKGAVRVFDFSAEEMGWTPVGQPIEGDYEQDEADTVTISGDGSILVIAADGDDMNPTFEGYRRTYKLDGCCTWKRLGEDLLGKSKQIALSSDATCLAVGIKGYQNDQGRCEVFRWSDIDSSWYQVAVTIGDRPQDRLGEDVTISGNCSLFAVGATRGNSPGIVSGYVRVYEVP